MSIPVVLSFGMGLDGAAILARWCHDPSSRDFDLAALLVVSAQTGGESQQTKHDVERYIFPLMRDHNIRYVQVARGGPSLKDGYVVLDDTREPTTLFIEGKYRLYDEMLASGTVPQYAQGKRQCSDKYKGEVVGRFLRDEYGNTSFRHVFGYAADEQRRIVKALKHEGSRRLNCRYEFSLQQWGWDRAACRAYSLALWGIVLARSCCSFCPFAETNGGTSEMLARYRQFPDEAATTMLLEHLSIALNPRMTLYADGKSVIATVRADGNDEAEQRYQRLLAQMPWALYEVERLYYKIGSTDRRLTTRAVGNLEAMVQLLHAEAQRRNTFVEADDRIVAHRAYTRRRTPRLYPDAEQVLVVAPALAQDKSKTRFAAAWAHHTQQTRLDLCEAV